jgi:hypothetical protein
MVARMVCSTMSESNPRFDAMLLESVDETLNSLLGKGATDSIYRNLERNRITKSDIPIKLNEFLATMEWAFGKPCKKILGKAIVEKLYLKLGLELVESPNTKCLDYIELARTKLDK